MMSKIPAVIAAAAFAVGTAAYAETEASHEADHTMQRSHAEHEGPSAGQKLRDSMHRLGEKTRHAFHRADDKTRDVAHRDRRDEDTHAMGASREPEHDRQTRMDEAYSNWHSKNDQDRR